MRQSLAGLSDAPAQFQILDRRRFHHFLGLTEADPVPDQNPSREFRAQLPRAERFTELFAAFNARLTPPGFSTRQGQISAAAFVEVPRQRNGREANAAIQRGAVPAGWETAAKRLAHKDLAARWTRQNQPTCSGCKDHLVADWESKLIVRAEVPAANEQDRPARDPRTRAGAPCQEIFAAKGSVAHVGEKGGRGQALTKGQKRSNRAQARQRARGEHLFGFKTGSMGAMFQRAIGFARHRAGISLTHLVYNLARTAQSIRLKLLGRKTPQLVSVVQKTK